MVDNKMLEMRSLYIDDGENSKSKTVIFLM